MTRAKTNRTSSICLGAAGLMLISIPFLRLIEAGLRYIFMRDHYGSFWEGLQKDVWFSEGWIAYVKTPLGLTMTLLPLALIVASVVCFIGAAKSTSAPKTKQA